MVENVFSKLKKKKKEQETEQGSTTSAGHIAVQPYGSSSPSDGIDKALRHGAGAGLPLGE